MAFIKGPIALYKVDSEPDRFAYWDNETNGWKYIEITGITGPQGPQGPQGEQGIQGEKGEDGASGSTTFLGLTDTPSSYSGNNTKLLIVNPAENALEYVRPIDSFGNQAGNRFIAGPGGGSMGLPTFRQIVTDDFPSQVITLDKLSGSGTAGQVLTSTGASTSPTMQDPITSTNGTATLASSHTLSSANGTFDALSGMSFVSLGGDYLISYTLRYRMEISAGSGLGWIAARIWDVTAGAEVANSRLWMNGIISTGVAYRGSAGASRVYTLVNGRTYRLEAARFSGTWTTSVIDSDTNGYTMLDWVKVSN